MDNYDVRKDDYFIGYFGGSSANDVSREKYAKEIAKLCKSMDMKFEDIVEECQTQQRTRIVPNEDNPIESIVVPFDANSPKSLAKIAQDTFVDFCKDRGNSNVTINNGVIVIRTFLKNYNISLPKWTPLDENYDDWEVLTKEDFIFVMKDSSLIHQSLITFMLSTGIRIGDCLSLTIGDFMKATKDCHDFVDVNDFIDNAPDDMLGYWEFNPKKTMRYKIKCATVNSPESSNYILQNLRRIKNQYLPRKSKRLKKELKMSKKCALFGSHHKKFKESMTVKSITDQFTLKSHKLHEWRVSQIKNDIAQGKCSEEDFEDLENKIPRFHPHGCRKFFIDTLDKNCADSRLRALMEGHKPPSKTDPSYVKKAKKHVMEAYQLDLVEHLTLENIESRKISEEVAKELQNEIDSLQSELEEVKVVSDKYKEEIWEKIYKYRLNHSNDIDKKDMVLCQYAFEHAIADIFNFKNNSEYIGGLFEYADAVNDMYPNRFDETYEKAKVNFKEAFINEELKKKVTKVLIASSNYGSIEKLVKKNYKEAEKKVLQVLENMDLTLEDLDDSEVVKEILSKAILGVT